MYLVYLAMRAGKITPLISRPQTCFGRLRLDITKVDSITSINAVLQMLAFSLGDRGVGSHFLHAHSCLVLITK
jgi:hypothetical protein